MPNGDDQRNGFASRFYLTTPTDGDTPAVEYYDIEALRLVDSISRNPVSIGDSTHPVYFLEGEPKQCSGGTGSGGGSDVNIYPKYRGGTLIANYSIDGVNGRIYSPSVAEIYKKVTLWPPLGTSDVYFSEVGDNNENNPFKTMISNYEFLLIHYAPSNNLVEERTMMLDSQVLVNALPNNAIFSCHYLSDVFIKCRFTAQNKFEVIESEGIPLDNEQEPTILRCAIKKIEGLQFGTSGEDLDQGLTVKQVLWDGTASQTETYTFKTGTVESYNYIYMHYYASNNPYEERILILDQEAIIEGLAQHPSSQAYFTCDILDDLYIKGKFIDINKFTITEVHTKTIDEEIVVPILSQIDGICMGSIGTITVGEGGDTSDCMKKGIDYVTAGSRYESSLIGENATAEGFKVISLGRTSHAEGYKTSAYGYRNMVSEEWDEDTSHAEGLYTYAVGSGSHAEGRKTIAIGSFATPAHAEGYETYAEGGDGVHAEGRYTTAWGIGAHAEGGSTYAWGAEAHAEGDETYAGRIGYQHSGCHAEGHRTYSYGNASHTEGFLTYAAGYGSHAEGLGMDLPEQTGSVLVSAIGDGSHAEGYSTTAKGHYSHAEGNCTSAYGQNSHAEGKSIQIYTGEVFPLIAQGNNSHAEGCATTAYGEDSHAEGYMTSAYSLFSHAEGNMTYAIGEGSHSEGQRTTAYGNYSHTNGIGTYAKMQASTAIGKYNELDTNNEYAFVIGKGSNENNRSNLFAIKWDGTIEINGREVEITYKNN